MLNSRGLAALIALALAPSAIGSALSAQISKADDLIELQKRVTDLNDAGKYKDATPPAEQWEALAKSRFGDQSAQHALALYYLGTLYMRQGRYSDAEPLLRHCFSERFKSTNARSGPIIQMSERI
jgi:uncharacterized protein HemY